jgi:hypothetical protein
MRLWDAWGPRNCWLNPDADDAILFACCMVNLGYGLFALAAITTAVLTIWRVFT